MTDITKEVARRISQYVDFLDFSPENSTNLITQTRDIVSKTPASIPGDVFNAEYVVEWQKVHREVYAHLLQHEYAPVQLLDMLLKLERNKTVKSIEVNVKNIFSAWKWQ